MPSLKLEDFGAVTQVPASDANLGMSADEVEVERLAAFDRGYSAGWEDATSAAEQDGERLKTELANTLRDMGFTFHEARAHVMRGLVPLLQAVVETVLPEAVQTTLGVRLQEEINDLAEDAADLPILLRTAPGEADAIRNSVADVPGLPIDLDEDSSVPPGQLFLILGRSEVNMDLAGPVQRLRDTLEALDTDMKEKLNA